MGGPQVSRHSATPGSILLTPEHRAAKDHPEKGCQPSGRASTSPTFQYTCVLVSSLANFYSSFKAPPQGLPPTGKTSLLASGRTDLP